MVRRWEKEEKNIENQRHREIEYINKWKNIQ